LREQTGNVYENKEASQEVESPMQEQSRAAAWGVFVNSSTLDYSTLNLKEQTGNVDENKGPSQEVEKSRSQEPIARAKSTGSLGRGC
jgi:hypothetical protein